MPDPRLDRVWERFAGCLGWLMAALFAAIAVFAKGCQ